MASLRRLPRSFFDRSAEEVAPDLLGRYLVRELDGERLLLRLVETEAYLGVEDRASHAWNGRRTPRVESLYGSPGTCYVYLIYGLHHCMNVVASGPRKGGAVLLRAAEALEGASTMERLRRLRRAPRGGDLAGGPGKLCQAVDVDRAFDGGSFLTGPLPARRGRAGHPRGRGTRTPDRSGLCRRSGQLAPALRGPGASGSVSTAALTAPTLMRATARLVDGGCSVIASMLL